MFVPPSWRVWVQPESGSPFGLYLCDTREQANRECEKIRDKIIAGEATYLACWIDRC